MTQMATSSINVILKEMPFKAELTHREVFHCFQNLGLVFPTEGQENPKPNRLRILQFSLTQIKTKQKCRNIGISQRMEILIFT